MKTATPRATIHFAYSPDSDDAFMAEALTSDAAPSTMIDWRFTCAEIHELNLAARRGVYDVTALSAAAYPLVSGEYVTLPVGASFGDGYGPSIVVPMDSPIRTPEDLRGRRVAVPGATTTAALALAALLGDDSPPPASAPYTVIEAPFLEVTNAVADGRAEAGLLIHELQMSESLTTASGQRLRRIDNLGAWWRRRFDLPLPLGIIAARRALGEPTLQEITRLQRASILAGLADRRRTLDIATTKAMAPVHGDDADRYIQMYVNDRTLDFGADGRRALEILFGACARLGAPPCPRDWLFAASEGR